MLELLKSVNDSMHQIAITGYQVPDWLSITVAPRLVGGVSALNFLLVTHRETSVSWVAWFFRVASACGSATRGRQCA